MPERENNGRKTIEEVQRLRARVAKLERIALRKAGPKDADRELDRAWSEWETTFDAIGDSVILLDSEFNILQANAATSSLLGKPLDEIVGQRCCKLVHGSNEPVENCPLIKTKTTKKRQKAELYVAEKGIWALVSVDSILDGQGNLTGAVHIIRDITERKKAEETLQFTRFAIDNAVDTMVCISQDARHIDVNDAFCRAVGYSREDLLSMTVHDIDPNYSAKTWSAFWEKLKRSGSLTFESCHRRKDGTVFPIEGTVTFFKYKGKEYHCGFARDITERKKAEEKIKIFSDAIASAFDCLMLTDSKGNFT